MAELSGIVTGSGRSANPPPRPATPAAASKPAKAASRPPERSSGLPLADALSLVTEAADRLWKPEGTEALADLHRRGLTDETIQAARFGVAPFSLDPDAGGGPLLSSPRCGYPVVRRGPTGPCEDSPARGEQAEVRRSVPRPTRESTPRPPSSLAARSSSSKGSLTPSCLVKNSATWPPS